MIPTAAEILKRDYTSSKENAINAMIEFAQMHVEAALQSASKSAQRKKVYSGHPQRLIVKRVIDKDSILNAYPLTNIK